MSKLSPNQAGAVQVLTDLLASSGADCASAGEWKRAVPHGSDVTITAKSLVAAGAVKLIKAKNRDTDKLSELYAPA